MDLKEEENLHVDSTTLPCYIEKRKIALHLMNAHSMMDVAAVSNQSWSSPITPTYKSLFSVSGTIEWVQSKQFTDYNESYFLTFSYIEHSVRFRVTLMIELGISFFCFATTCLFVFRYANRSRVYYRGDWKRLRIENT